MDGHQKQDIELYFFVNDLYFNVEASFSSKKNMLSVGEFLIFYEILNQDRTQDC